MRKPPIGDCQPFDNLIKWVKEAKASDEYILKVCGHVPNCPKCRKKLIPLKKFEHFKGGIYKVVGFAVNSVNLEYLVIYKAGRETWTRPIIDFFTPARLGRKLVPRFKEVD